MKTSILARTASGLMALTLALAGCNGNLNDENPTPLPPVVSDALTAQGRIVPRRFAELSFPAAGVVAESLVREGDQVEAGQVLARLDTVTTLQAEVARTDQEVLAARQALTDLRRSAGVDLANAQLAVANARQKLSQASRKLRGFTDPNIAEYNRQIDRANDVLLNSTGDAQIADLQLQVRDAIEALRVASNNLNEARQREQQYPGGFTDDVRAAQQAYDRAADLARSAQLRLDEAQRNNQNAVEDARRTLTRAQNNLNSILQGGNEILRGIAEGEVAVAQAELDRAQEVFERYAATGDDREKITAAEARIATAEASLAAALKNLADAELRAPFAGTITDLQLRLGERVSGGQVTLTLADFSAWLLRTTDLNENEVVRVQIGQPVSVRLDAVPNTPLQGQVETIVQRFTESRGEIVYTTTVVLSDTTPLMRWGMTATSDFTQGARPPVTAPTPAPTAVP